ncbi:MAG: molybdopterin adenylyltransferase [Verrucomicrobia bacterium]|nr:MAG: molybdopterin adenylyltransferase [Verrucomicrobiota bacterium]
MKIGRITISDRASRGEYEDLGGPAIEREVNACFAETIEWLPRLVADEIPEISSALLELIDQQDCWIVFTTGGTGPALRDVTPEATRNVLERELPGLAEAMRMGTFDRVPTSILSRAVAGIRQRALVVNFPGNPKAIGECLPLIAPALAEAVTHLRGVRPRLHPRK